jgi:serine/threonine protein phosphatase PrpC
MANEPNVSLADMPTGEFLYKLVSPKPPHLRVSTGAMTHVGLVRAQNEDQFLVATLAKALEVKATSLSQPRSVKFSRQEGHLFVVADGMGGAAAGEKASALAVQSVERFVLDAVDFFLTRPGAEQSTLASELSMALERADRAVIKRAESDLRLTGMGTTLTLAYAIGTDLFVAHAGDSRAYLYRDGQLGQITRDHTLVQAMVDEGLLTPEDARTHVRRHVVTNVLGGPGEGVQAEIRKIALMHGDVLLLCSDGLSEPVGDARIAEVLGTESDPETAAKRLIELALESGGPDNITAVVVKFFFDE